MTDEKDFREVMGTFPTGVTVVATVGPDGDRSGLTVNSFTSVSLDPPLVLVCIDRDAASHGVLLEAEAFSVSVLAEEQAEVARRFAAEPSAGRFESVGWEEREGLPVLEGVVGWLLCSIVAVHPAGDHSIVVGRVRSLGTSEGRPLVFHRGAFASVGT